MTQKFQNTQEQIPELLDYNGLLKWYNLSKSTISKLVMVGGFTNVVKIGRKNFFRRIDVEAWIDANTIKVGG